MSIHYPSPTLWAFCLLTLLGCLPEKEYCRQALSCDDAATDHSNHDAAREPGRTSSVNSLDASGASPSMTGADGIEEGTLPGAPASPPNGSPTTSVEPPDAATPDASFPPAGGESLDASMTAINDGAPPSTSVQRRDASDGSSRQSSNNVDASPVPPEGGCMANPQPPVNDNNAVATFGECMGTLNGGTCEFVCPEGYIGGVATCEDGNWSTVTCTAQSRVTAVVGNAATGDRLSGALVYVQDFFAPLATDSADPDLVAACLASPYCKLSNDEGELYFGRFPSGDQHVVVLADGIDPIPLPVSIVPDDEASVRWDALPIDFLDGNVVIVLDWSARTDLDLTVRVPTDPPTCVAFSNPGNLVDEPWADFEHDSKILGADTIRIAQNEEQGGPFLDGTYEVYVAAAVTTPLEVAKPSLRVFRSIPGESAQVYLFELPDNAMEGATGWHAFDLLANGSAVEHGQTEVVADFDQTHSAFPCLDTIYLPPEE